MFRPKLHINCLTILNELCYEDYKQRYLGACVIEVET